MLKKLKKLTNRRGYCNTGQLCRNCWSFLKRNHNNIISFFILGIPFFIELFVALNYKEPYYFMYIYNSYRIFEKILEAFAIFIAIYVLFNTSASKLVRKISLALWVFVLYIPTCLDLISARVTGTFLSNDFMFAIYNTHLRETLLIFKDYSVFIIINLVILYYVFHFKAQKSNFNKKYSISAAVFLVISIYCSGLQPFNGIWRSYQAYLKDLKDSDELNSMKEPITDIKLASNDKQTYVLVIGESVDRKHMGIYGYTRNTTPCFEKKKNELFVFKDVMTAHVITAVAVKSMLLIENRNNKNYSLLSFFKSAGFKTFWFSNQGKVDMFDNTIMRFGRSCDEYAFVHGKDVIYSSEDYNIHFKDEQRRLRLWDENLLSYYKKALQDPADKKLIVLHLNGSHIPIDARYPPDFNIFTMLDKYYDRTKALAVCVFDNSIAYTDYLLDKVIKWLKQQNETSAMLYLSDHGQDINDTEECCLSGRGWPIAYEVPFVVWISDKYRQQNADFVKQWNLQKKFVTDKTAYSIIDLVRMSHPLVDLSYSIFTN